MTPRLVNAASVASRAPAAWSYIRPAGQAAGDPLFAPVTTAPPAALTTTPAAPTAPPTGLVVAGAADYCPSLPSSNSAYEAVAGVPGGWLKVARDWAIRGGLIATGLYLYDREDPHPILRALAGSAAIEGFVLLWTWWRLGAFRAQQAAAQPPTPLIGP